MDWEKQQIPCHDTIRLRRDSNKVLNVSVLDSLALGTNWNVFRFPARTSEILLLQDLQVHWGPPSLYPNGHVGHDAPSPKYSVCGVKLTTHLLLMPRSPRATVAPLHGKGYQLQTATQSQSQSHIATDGQSVSMSWSQVHSESCCVVSAGSPLWREVGSVFFSHFRRV
jgi:hypothetical protein